MLWINVIIIAILLTFTAFFVASEFAIVKVRTTRIDQLISEGNRKAETAKKVISNLDGYLSATQVGITITSLILGWLGEPTVRELLSPVFDMAGFTGIHHTGSFLYIGFSDYYLF